MDTRPTFEQAYRNMIGNSSLYQLKGESFRITTEAAYAAAHADEKATNDLIEVVCDDMVKLFDRKYTPYHSFNFTNHTEMFMIGRGDGWCGVLLGEYKRRLPGFINTTLDRIIPKVNTMLGRPQIGWVKWVGNNATVNVGVLRLMLEYPDAEIRCPQEFALPKHVQEMMERLRTTKLNYQPFVLTGANGRKSLAIRFGCAWKDVAVCDWMPAKYDRVQKMDFRMMGVAMGLMTLMIWFTVLTDSWILAIFTGVIALACAAITGLIGTHLYDRNYKPIKV